MSLLERIDNRMAGGNAETSANKRPRLSDDTVIPLSGVATLPTTTVTPPAPSSASVAFFQSRSTRPRTPPPDDFPSDPKDFMDLEATSFMLTAVKFKLDIEGRVSWGPTLNKMQRLRVRKVHRALIRVTQAQEKVFLNGSNLPLARLVTSVSNFCRLRSK